ncbi:hypothetical protein ABGB17_21230 [Sphaerisporangium sp. B11E5]|uniref:hypothetical protein n=1 Tax=Sphaerisporangium sp. B11E5 TaxID=3153563 RepID=UPI00325F3210
MLELAETIRRLAGSRSPIHHISRPVVDPTVRRPDTSLAARRLGWRPRVDATTGLRRTIEWFADRLERDRATAQTAPMSPRGTFNPDATAPRSDVL